VNWAPLAEDDPLPGDPQGVAQLVSLLRDEALALTDTATQLQGIDAGTIWQGDAATAFRQRQEHLKPDLDLVEERIHGTIQALDQFARAVDIAQSEGLRALASARDAEERIARAQLGIETMAGQVGTPEGPALSGPLARPDPGPVWGPNWQGQLDEADMQMAAARRLFADACEIYRDAEHRCDRTLAQTVHDDLADPHPRGVFGSIGHAFANIADHFTSLEGFSELMGATAAVCGVAGMVPFLSFLEPVAFGATGLKTLADLDLAAVRHEKGAWNKVRQDAFALGVFSIGRVATVAARGKVASRAAADLRRVMDYRSAGLLKEFEGVTAEGRVVGPQGARLLKNQSVRLLREFGDDEFTGALPSWNTSIRAMRYFDIELPAQGFLDLSPSAVRWANTARVAQGAQGFSDVLEVKRLVDPTGAHPAVLAEDAGAPRPPS